MNPTQFGPNEDFTRYPRDLEKDLALLEKDRVDLVFVPSVEEMYPQQSVTWVTVEGLSDRLCGRSRPGHFRGVATVVLKLFEIVEPQFAYFGRKDAQQVRILQQMASDLNVNVEIIVCPIIREPDGLALSSRNSYLNPEERRAASALHRALGEAQREVNLGTRDATQLHRAVHTILSSAPLVRVDYLEIVDAETFEAVSRIGVRPVYVLLAAYIGRTRLIDNLFIAPAPGLDNPLCSL